MERAMIERRLDEVCSNGRIISQRYHSKNVLGRGGMGWAIRAEDSLLPGQDVVLKFLYPHLVEKEGAVGNLRSEVLIARRLIHPHIVRTFHFSFDGSLGHFIVMEFIQGVTLRKVIDSDSQTLSISRIIEMIFPVLLGIRHAHSLGVIHLDIKPENIFLTKETEPKLGDFGLAKQILGIGGLSDRMQGTPLYMAPEQFRAGVLSRQTDIYAIGIILFEMICGKPPFVSNTLYNMSQLHLHEPLPSLKDIRHPPPDWLIGVIEKCCAKQAEDRFESVDEIIRVFEHFSENETCRQSPAHSYTPPSPSSPFTYQRKPRFRFNKPVLVAVLFILFLSFVHFGRKIGWVHTSLLYTVMKFERVTGIHAPVTRFLFRLRTKREDSFWDSRFEAGAIWSQLENGALVDQENGPRRLTFLHELASSEATERVFYYLLEHGANPNQQDKDGRAPLHDLAGPDSLNRAEQLLRYGAKINLQDGEGVTPLLSAVRKGNVELARMLFASGGDPTLADNTGRSPEDEAARSSDLRLRSLFVGH